MVIIDIRNYIGHYSRNYVNIVLSYSMLIKIYAFRDNFAIVPLEQNMDIKKNSFYNQKTVLPFH